MEIKKVYIITILENGKENVYICKKRIFISTLTYIYRIIKDDKHILDIFNTNKNIVEVIEIKEYYNVKKEPIINIDSNTLTIDMVVKAIKDVSFLEEDDANDIIKEVKDNINKLLNNPIQKEIKDDFVLPEKWCILKNKESICNYFRNKTGRLYTLESKNNEYIHHPDYRYDIALSNNIEKGYTEITFEQFKKYVLKENNYGQSIKEEVK